jgi:hypothetical protein
LDIFLKIRYNSYTRLGNSDSQPRWPIIKLCFLQEHEREVFYVYSEIFAYHILFKFNVVGFHRNFVTESTFPALVGKRAVLLKIMNGFSLHSINDFTNVVEILCGKFLLHCSTVALFRLTDLQQNLVYIKNRQTPWSESARELYRPSDLRLSAKLVPTFADRGCHVVSVTDPYGRIVGF